MVSESKLTPSPSPSHGPYDDLGNSQSLTQRSAVYVPAREMPEEAEGTAGQAEDGVPGAVPNVVEDASKGFTTVHAKDAAQPVTKDSSENSTMDVDQPAVHNLAKSEVVSPSSERHPPPGQSHQAALPASEGVPGAPSARSTISHPGTPLAESVPLPTKQSSTSSISARTRSFSMRSETAASFPGTLGRFRELLNAAGAFSLFDLTANVPPIAIVDYVAYLQAGLPEYLSKGGQSTPFTMALLHAYDFKLSTQPPRIVQPFTISVAAPFPEPLSTPTITKLLRDVGVRDYAQLVLWVPSEYLAAYLSFLDVLDPYLDAGTTVFFSLKWAFQTAYRYYPLVEDRDEEGRDAAYPRLSAYQAAILREHGYDSESIFIEEVNIDFVDDFLLIVAKSQEEDASVTRTRAMKRALSALYVE